MVNDILDNIFQVYNNIVHSRIPENSLTNKLKAVFFDLALWSKVSRQEDYLIGDVTEKIKVKMDDRAGFNALISESNYVERFIREFDNQTVFVDVGGHHGFYSILASYLTKGDIISFEIDEENLQHFRRNIELNDSDISLVPKAVSNSVGQEKFNMEGTGLSSIGKGDEMVTTTTLDSEIDSEIDLLKIDVEGAELKVLEGAKSVLEQYKPLIFIEVHKKDRLDSFEHNPKDVKDFLRDRGYNMIPFQKGKYDDLYLAKPE